MKILIASIPLSGKYHQFVERVIQYLYSFSPLCPDDPDTKCELLLGSLDRLVVLTCWC